MEFQNNDTLVSKIEAATNELLMNADWSTNMEICDMVSNNRRVGGPAMTCIKQRMKVKSVQTNILAIQLVETLINNCPVFHPFVATNDFMGCLARLANLDTKKDPKKSKWLGGGGSSAFERKNLKFERRERALKLIQNLGISFANSRSYPIFRNTLESLRYQGVRFPEPDKDAAPIFTPPVNISAAANMPVRADLKLPEKISSSEMATHRDNAVLLFEMLDGSALDEDLKANDIVSTLVQTCRLQQTQLMNSLQSPNIPEQRMADTLALNDVLSQAIGYHDNLLAGRVSRKQLGGRSASEGGSAASESSSEESATGSESGESEESDELSHDMLGLNMGGGTPKAKKAANSRGRSRKPKADKSHIPTLAPPRSNRAVRKSSSPASERKPSGGGASHTRGPASESNIEDFFTFGDSKPAEKAKPADEFDAFFELASRDDPFSEDIFGSSFQSAAQTQPQQPYGMGGMGGVGQRGGMAPMGGVGMGRMGGMNPGGMAPMGGAPIHQHPNQGNVGMGQFGAGTMPGGGRQPMAQSSRQASQFQSQPADVAKQQKRADNANPFDPLY
eukprot:944330_1